LRKESPTLLSSKVIDLSKKNRDMAAQNEMMKAKVQQLLADNESMKRMIPSHPNMNGSGDAPSVDGSGNSQFRI